MTTFQAIVYAVIHGFTEILPVSSAAHHVLVPYLIGWEEPTSALLAAMSSGVFLALLVYFRHDWASMVSSMLQILIFRRKPMTLDERLPFFVILATLPLVAGWYYLAPMVDELRSHEYWKPTWIAGALAAFSLPLWFFDSMSRKTKRLYDWNWLDSLVIGVTHLLTLVPFAGRPYGAWTGAMFRNYSREAAAKFMFFTALPLIGGSAFLRLKGIETGTGAPSADLSWLSFAIALVVSFLTSLLAIGGFMKHIQRGGMGQYVVYRFLLATAVIGVSWYKTRG